MFRNVRATVAIALPAMLVAFCSGCITRRDPEKVAVEEADVYAAERLLKEAAEKYRAILQKNEGNIWAKRNLGLVCLKMRDYSCSISNLEVVSQKFINDFDLNYALAESYRTSEKYPEAIFRYQRALELSPRDTRASKGLAWSYYKLRYYPEALASIRQYKPRSNDQDDGQAAVIEARILARMDRFDEALKTIRFAKRQIGDKAGLAYLLSVEGEVLASRGDCISANRVFRDSLRRQPLLAGPLLGIGKCFIKDDKAELAVEYLERAVRIRPSLTEGFFLLSDALRESDPTKAQRYFKKFRQLAVNDPEWQGQLKTLAAKFDQNETEKVQR